MIKINNMLLKVTKGDECIVNGKLEIPKGVKIIRMFAACDRELIDVTFPEDLETIGCGSFMHNRLKKVIIPNKVTLIEDWAFQNNNIMSVTLLNSETVIEESVFYENPIREIVVLINGEKVILDQLDLNGIKYNGLILGSLIIECAKVKKILKDKYGINNYESYLALDNEIVTEETSKLLLEGCDVFMSIQKQKPYFKLTSGNIIWCCELSREIAKLNELAKYKYNNLDISGITLKTDGVSGKISLKAKRKIDKQNI